MEVNEDEAVDIYVDYDFDPENGKGAGLLLNEQLEMDGIFM